MTNPLVTTEWLYEHLQDDNLRIVDIRGHVLPASEPHPHYFSHKAEYDESHIPNALFVDWVTDLTNPDSPNGTQIATPDAFAQLMGKLGIDENTFVVVYDDANGMFSARLWWGLNYYGHENVAVLNGGWQKWTSEERPISSDSPTISPTTFITKPNTAIRTTIDQVEASLNGSIQLIDVRSPMEFAGEASRAKRMGHIPGAINLPRKSLLAESGELLPLDALKDKIEAAGIKADGDPIVTYCNGGVSAPYGMLALKVAGYEHVSMYDGSWKEWGNDESKPIV